MLVLRGRPVTQLAEKATLEDVAVLLWGGTAPRVLEAMPLRLKGAAKARAFAFLAQRAAGDAPGLGRAEAALRGDAWSLLDGFGQALTGEARGAMHQRLARAWGLSPRGADLVRRVLVLQSDHELNPSTFAVRIAASTGASLAACALGGFSALSGPLHGEAAARALAQLDEAMEARDADEGVALLLSRGERLAGLGHPLYPEGDVRASAMLKALKPRAGIARVIAAMEQAVGRRANCDAALAAMTRELGLPDDAPFVMFALSRMTGWLAHAIEQRASGKLIRPRAKYIGV
jgi:citrate synthase